MQLHILWFNFCCWRRGRVSYVACREWRWWVIWRISKEELSSLTPVKWFRSCLKCPFALFKATKEFATSGITRVHYSKERDSKKKEMQAGWRTRSRARQSARSVDLQDGRVSTIHWCAGRSSSYHSGFTLIKGDEGMTIISHFFTLVGCYLHPCCIRLCTYVCWRYNHSAPQFCFKCGWEIVHLATMWLPC